MKCICESCTELQGSEAISYAKEHLHKVRVDAINWEVEYICPDTGRKWIMDYPHAEAHGGGPPRLRLISTSSNT